MAAASIGRPSSRRSATQRKVAEAGPLSGSTVCISTAVVRGWSVALTVSTRRVSSRSGSSASSRTEWLKIGQHAARVVGVAKEAPIDRRHHPAAHVAQQARRGERGAGGDEAAGHRSLSDAAISSGPMTYQNSRKTSDAEQHSKAGGDQRVLRAATQNQPDAEHAVADHRVDERQRKERDGENRAARTATGAAADRSSRSQVEIANERQPDSTIVPTRTMSMRRRSSRDCGRIVLSVSDTRPIPMQAMATI